MDKERIEQRLERYVPSLNPQLREMFEIWFEFGMSQRGDEDNTNRIRKLRELAKRLTNKSEETLEKPVPNGYPEEYQGLTIGLYLQKTALKAADEKKAEIRRLKAEEQKLSKGEKLHRRRQKAATHGTDPRRIH